MKILAMGIAAGILLVGCGAGPAGVQTGQPAALLKTQATMTMQGTKDMSQMTAACAASMSMTPEAMAAMMASMSVTPEAMAAMMASGSMMADNSGSTMTMMGMMSSGQANTATPAPATADTGAGDHAAHH